MSNLIITEEFLTSFDTCEPALTFISENQLWGKTEDEILQKMREADLRDHVAWWYRTKRTEQFVRLTGKEFTMGAFHVFNPLNGEHTEHETEEEARQQAVLNANAVLQANPITVVQSMSNENGDATWVSTQFNNPLQVS